MTQDQAFEIMKMGYNVFLTGPAGSGKTFLLNKYLDYLRENQIKVGVTASTGIAATHIGGITIHSWSGVGVKDEISDEEIEVIIKRPWVKKNFRGVSVLVIDEISMLHAFQLDMVDRVCQKARSDTRPFGGLQVIFCGDFFQLPPVGEDFDFAYDSQVWNDMNLKVCYLREQHRQKDNKLLQILNNIRSNIVDENDVALLHSRRGKKVEKNIDPTKLYSHNVDVDIINNKELGKIEGDIMQYTMQLRGSDKLCEVLKKNCLAPEKLQIKKGALVMFVKNNFDEGYVNGTLGKVVDYDERNFPIIEIRDGIRVVAEPQEWIIDDEGFAIARITQIPLRLAWAITIHKSQGMSLEAVEIDLGKAFEPGMGYVAISRASDLSGICLNGLNRTALEINMDVFEYDKKLEKMSDGIVVELKNMKEGEKKGKQALFVELAKETKKKARRKKAKDKISTYEKTKKLTEEKKTIAEIAKERGLTEGTVMGHLEKIRQKGDKMDLSYMRPKDDERFEKIAEAFAEVGVEALAPVREALGDDYTWDELRLARLFLD